MEKLLLKNIRIPDPDTYTVQHRDVLVMLSDNRGEGRIMRISEDINAEDARIIEGKGGYALPAFCDIASDFCEPGHEYRETVETGSLSAFYGGYSHVMLTPDTSPFADTPETLKRIDRIIDISSRCSVLKCGALTVGGKGTELCDYEILHENGAVCFSDGNFPTHDMKVLRQAMLACAKHDYIVMLTPMRDPLYTDSVMNEGRAARMLSVPSEPASAEARCIWSYIMLAQETGCRVHIRNISAAASVDAIRVAKQQGVRISASTSAPYFSLTDNDTVFIGTNAKIYPPLRSQYDREAVIRGLGDTTIDCIESSHIPLSPAEKSGGMCLAGFGSIGLQNTFGCALTYLVTAGHIDIFRLIELMAINPAKIMGLNVSRKVDENCRAFVLCDLSKEMILTASYLKNRSRNCPYIGMSLRGEVRKTFIL